MEKENVESQGNQSVPERGARSARFYSGLYRWRSLLRRLWWIPALTLTLGLGVQWLILTNTTPVFISIGKMIMSGRLAIAEGTLYTEELVNFMGTQSALMNCSEVQTKADERVRKTRPDLTPVPVKVDVGFVPKTTIFVLKASGTEKEYTQLFLQGCLQSYIDLKKSMRTRTSETTLAGITEEVSRLERDLRKGEEELVTFQASNSVVFLQEQGNSAASYLSLLNRQLADLRTEFQLLNMLSFEQNLERRQVKSLSGDPAAATGSPDPLQSDSNYLRGKQEIQMLKADQQELSQYLRPKHPKMVKLSEEIASRERLLNIFREQSQEQLVNRRSALSMQISNLVQKVEEWEGKSVDASRKIAEFTRLKSNNQRVQTLYDRLLATMQTLDLNKEISPESVTIMENASVARVDLGNVTKMMLLAGFAGLAVGIGILLLLNQLDDRLNSYTELKSEFDEEVLGQIPRDRRNRRGGEVQLIHREDDRHAFVESYRNLRSSLLYISNTGPRPKLLLVTSSIPNDGKSMTTANLAITMALSGARVLLVDADLRKGVQHQRFQLKSSPGLTEALSENLPWRAHVQPTSVPNLSLLPRGATTQHSSALFLNAATTVFLKESVTEYDFVIIDSPPVMAADDVTSLSPNVDGVLFVIRAQQTSARVAHAALELLYQRQVNVLGLVFNAVEANVSEYYYYKYRDYYASYPTK